MNSLLIRCGGSQLQQRGMWLDPVLALGLLAILMFHMPWQQDAT
jgi:hypothetical protein